MKLGKNNFLNNELNTEVFEGKYIKKTQKAKKKCGPPKNVGPRKTLVPKKG